MSKLKGNSWLGICYRRIGLGFALALLGLGPVPAARASATKEQPTSHHCPRCRAEDCWHHGQRGAGGPGRGYGAMGDGPNRPAMENAHFLIDHHQHLRRTVEDVPGGVRTRTTTDDPTLTDRLREHVQEMADLLDEGGRIRNWDPLFNEIFDHRDAIDIEIRDIDHGVEVVETSEDEQVIALIRAHARKVEEFVARGRAACHEETPLPPGYSDSGR